MNHHFSRITLTPEGINHRVQMMSHHSYDLHKEMWNLFPGEPDANRGFLYSIMDDGRTIYMVSEREPVFNNYWAVESKPYDPVVKKGGTYRFRLCANPTVARTIDGKHHRHDVVMDLKCRLRDEGITLSQNDIVDRAVTQWIIRKGEDNGFSVATDRLLIHSYERNQTSKGRGSRIVFSTVVIEGILTVTDVESFHNALFKGIGSAKGFGCGLLMLRHI